MWVLLGWVGLGYGSLLQYCITACNFWNYVIPAGAYGIITSDQNQEQKEELPTWL